MQTAGWSPDVERWESDEDSSGSESDSEMGEHAAAGPSE